MIRSIGVFLVLVAGQAQALSCDEPNPVDSYQRYNNLPEDYVIFRGVLDVPEYELNEQDNNPKFDTDGTRIPNASVTASLAGQLLTLRGFKAPAPETVQVDIYCQIGWCGFVPNQEFIGFAKRDATGLTLSVDICSPAVIPSPDRAMERQLVNCLYERGCEAAN